MLTDNKAFIERLEALLDSIIEARQEVEVASVEARNAIMGGLSPEPLSSFEYVVRHRAAHRAEALLGDVESYLDDAAKALRDAVEEAREGRE